MKVIERVLEWFSVFFKGAISHEHYLPIKREPFQYIEPEVPVTKEPSRSTKPETPVKKDSWIHSKKNLSELLDLMEETFHLFSIPASQHPAGTDRETIKGIKTFGPVVPCYAVGDDAFDDAKKHKDDSGYVPSVDLDLIKKSSFMCMKNYFDTEKGKEKEAAAL